MLKYIRPLAILVTLLGSAASSVYEESFLAAQSDCFCIHFDKMRNALSFQGTIKLKELSTLGFGDKRIIIILGE